MARGTNMKLISAAVLGLFSGYASAAGFQLLEQNASGIGNAYAGSAAVADNASTIFYNPAGMTQLQAREFSAGVTAVQTKFDFKNSGSTNPFAAPGTPANGPDGNGGTLGIIPNGYMSWALSKDLYVGVGVGAPFGLKTEYDNNWKGRYQSQSFDIKTYNINPSIAYRVNDKVSLGFGLNVQRFETEYIRQATPTAKVTLTANDTAYGWNAGALFTLSEATKVGVSYRSQIKYDLKGDLKGAVNSPAKADLTLPDTFILSVTQKLSDRWEMLGDVSWTGWSSIPKLDIMYNSGASKETLDTQFKDTWRVALGTNYKYNDAMTFKFGIAYDKSPVPNAEHRLASLPDNDRTWVSTGLQWKPSKTSALDVGVAYLFVKDTEINHNGGAGKGLVKGSYDSSGILLGAQYSMAF